MTFVISPGNDDVYEDKAYGQHGRSDSEVVICNDEETLKNLELDMGANLEKGQIEANTSESKGSTEVLPSDVATSTWSSANASERPYSTRWHANGEFIKRELMML